MRLWTHLFLLLSHGFFLPLTVDRERAASSQSVIKDSQDFTYRMKKEVRPRNEINIVMIDSSFTDLWFVFFFFFFLTCQTSLTVISHLVSTQLQRWRWQFSCLLILTRQILVSHGEKCYCLSKETQAVTSVSSSGKINLDYGTGSVLWELQTPEYCTTLPSCDFSRYNTFQAAAFPH